MSLHRIIRAGDRYGRLGKEAWLIAVNGIIADTNDPEGMHRVRVIIPSIDESFVHDEWVTHMMPWVGPQGYGPVNLPAVGSEVVLFGTFGQPYSLFCISRFNEDFKVPNEFSGNVRGLKTDGGYKLLADLLIEIISGTQVVVQANSEVDIDAQDVWIRDKGAASIHTQGSKVGFLGAAPAEQQTLPPDATDLETCKALCNALKHLIAIKFGFAG